MIWSKATARLRLAVFLINRTLRITNQAVLSNVGVSAGTSHPETGNQSPALMSACTPVCQPGSCPRHSFRDRRRLQFGSSDPPHSEVQLSSAILTSRHWSSAISILVDTFLQPPFGNLCRISGGNRSSNSSTLELSSIAMSPRSGSVMTNSGPFSPQRTLAFVTRNPLTRRATSLSVSILLTSY